jgi:hypothetical protein
MAEVTSEQMAQLLIGIARSQTAVIRALTEGDVSLERKIIASLQGFSGVSHSPQPPVTLESLPTRILLQYQAAMSLGKPERLEEWVRGELHKLLGPAEPT